MLRPAETICKTDTGRQRRDNEDSALARSPVFVVADGMGGAQAGEVASRIAIETFAEGLEDSGDPEDLLRERVALANRRIYERSRSDRDSAGMGTTITAAYVEDAGVAIAHVGDSRAYVFRDGELRRVTQDHSLVDELFRQGKLTEEQAAEHPQRSIITRALGPEPEVEIDTSTFPAQAGDVILLCSDGLTSMLSDAEVSEVLAAESSLSQAADELITRANAAGGRDNITVILVRLEDVSADGRDSGAALAPQEREDESGEMLSTAQTATALRPRPPEPRDPPPSPGPTAARRPPKHAKLLAAVIAITIVLCLILGGGYLASRQLYFIGTNAQGIVTVYRGFPYNLLLGIHLYETYYVSGVPASLVPVDRRGTLFNNQLRSQADASSLMRALELGQVSR